MSGMFRAGLLLRITYLFYLLSSPQSFGFPSFLVKENNILNEFMTFFLQHLGRPIPAATITAALTTSIFAAKIDVLSVAVVIAASIIILLVVPKHEIFKK
jgi:hypothetical protein